MLGADIAVAVMAYVSPTDRIVETKPVHSLFANPILKSRLFNSFLQKDIAVDGCDYAPGAAFSDEKDAARIGCPIPTCP